MNRYRGPFSSSAVSSKATPSTRCQKCLKLGHYSYDCKASATERPYISRPSRTQQLLNPDLRQELTEASPPLINKKKGTADEILKQKLRERGRARSSEGRGRKRRRNSPSPSPARSRTRSLSTGSSSSYSSISSGRSPTPPARSQDLALTRRNSSRRQSNSHARDDHDRSVRRKYRDSPSPGRRGRRLSPTDLPRRTRSRTPRPTHRRSITPNNALPKRMGSPVRSHRVNENAFVRRPSPPRKRSLSPFTQRKLLTEQMQRGGTLR